MNSPTCRSCGADVVWAITVNDKTMPVDPDPHPDGNITLTDHYLTTHRRGRFRRAAVLGPLEVELHDGPLWLSHFVSCPDAGSWRK